MSDAGYPNQWTMDQIDMKAEADERKSCEYWLARAERLNAHRPQRLSGQFRRDTHLLRQH